MLTEAHRRPSMPRSRPFGRRPALAGLAVLAIVAAASTPARADDGVYGRFDGDLDLRIAAGAAFAAPGPSLCASAAVVYLATAGVYAHYTDALGAPESPVARSIAAGVHLQPLFLGRYGSDLERGPARLDLLIDSLALGVGSFWDAPRGAGRGGHPGLELSLSLGLPLLASATGPFIGLRGALRWRAAELAHPDGDGRAEQRALLSVTLGWHHIAAMHIVDARDRATWRQRAGAPAATGRR